MIIGTILLMAGGAEHGERNIGFSYKAALVSLCDLLERVVSDSRSVFSAVVFVLFSLHHTILLQTVRSNCGLYAVGERKTSKNAWLKPSLFKHQSSVCT